MLLLFLCAKVGTKGVDGFVETILFLIGRALKCSKLVTEFLDCFLEIRYWNVDNRKPVREVRVMVSTNALEFVCSARNDRMISFRLSSFWLAVRWDVASSWRSAWTVVSRCAILLPKWALTSMKSVREQMNELGLSSCAGRDLLVSSGWVLPALRRAISRSRSSCGRKKKAGCD